MDIKIKTREIEEGLQGHLPLPMFLRLAKISRATWTRWKAGISEPQPAKWGQVNSHFQAIMSAAKKSADGQPQQKEEAS